MSNIDKQGRQVQRYANFGVDMMEWADGGYVKHSDYLAMLDELEAKDKLNSELMEKQRLIDICQGQGLEHRIAAEKRVEAAEKRIAELTGENEYIRKRFIESDLLFGKNLLVMQAAIIEWQGTGDARKGLAWIYNTLWGPGELPDELEKDAQAYFDRKYAPLDEELMALHRWFWEQSEADRAAMLQGAERVSNSDELPVWVACSERMPDETQPVITVSDGGVVQRTVYQFCEGVWSDWYEQHDDVRADAFTHWMPLPAAPQQEVK